MLCPFSTLRFAVLLGALALTGCGGDNSTTSNPDGSVTQKDAATDHDAAQDAGTDASELPSCGFAWEDTIAASITLSADDNRVLYVNGTLVDDTTYGWNQPSTYQIELFRHPTRENVIAVKGVNLYQQGGYDRGVVVGLVTDADAGVSFELVSDASWLIATDEATDWYKNDFDDASWVAATAQTANGTGPWGTIANISTNASWLWSYDSATANSKPDAETIYLRRAFYIDESGAVSADSANCK